MFVGVILRESRSSRTTGVPLLLYNECRDSTKRPKKVWLVGFGRELEFNFAFRVFYFVNTVETLMAWPKNSQHIVPARASSRRVCHLRPRTAKRDHSLRLSLSPSLLLSPPPLNSLSLSLFPSRYYPLAIPLPLYLSLSLSLFPSTSTSLFYSFTHNTFAKAQHCCQETQYRINDSSKTQSHLVFFCI